MIIYTWSKQRMIVWALSLLGSRCFSDQQPELQAGNWEQNQCQRVCVCVLWRQQVGLWIPYPARRHEAHAQEASPAKYSWPPSPTLPFFIYRSAAHWELNSESSLLFSSPLLIPQPSTAVSFNELSVVGFCCVSLFSDHIFQSVNVHDRDLTPLCNHTDTQLHSKTPWPSEAETL